MKNVLTIVKKELTRFFKDKRLLITTLILPAVLIYVLYSFMGTAIFSQLNNSDEYVPLVYVNDIPNSIDNLLTTSEIKLEKKSYSLEEIEAIKEQITNQEADLLLIFSDDFDQMVAEYQTGLGDAPYILMYYNSGNTSSYTIYQTLESLFNSYESIIANKFDINMQNDKFDLVTDENVSSMIFSMILPFLILTFLFSACMSVAPESISGEKERGTIATLLVTPIKRSELAIGKIISLSIIAILSAISSFIGVVTSIPKLLGGLGEDISVSASVYAFKDYLLLLLIIMTTVLVIISIMAILSSLAKSVKEATTIISPLMIIVMLVGITSMFGNVNSNLFVYLIPIYNSIQAMGSILSFNISYINILVTIVSNVCYSLLFIYFLTKIFNSEKIMFTR